LTLLTIFLLCLGGPVFGQEQTDVSNRIDEMEKQLQQIKASLQDGDDVGARVDALEEALAQLKNEISAEDTIGARAGEAKTPSAEADPIGTTGGTQDTTNQLPPPGVQGAPNPMPQPTTEPIQPEDEATPAVGTSTGDQPAGATGAEVSKKDQVTNPGDVAFTDYAPFDLDAIEPEPFQSKWKSFVAGMRGIGRYSLFDGNVKFRLGFSAKVDGTAGNGTRAYEEAYGPIDSGLGLRFGIVYAAGRIKDLNFNVGIDLGADPGIDSAWVEGAKGGLVVWGRYLGKLRLGIISEPFSLERQGSTYNTSLMERSLPVQAFAPGYNTGAKIHNSRHDGRLSWAAGIFSFGQNNEKNASNSLLSLTGRVTYLPVYRDEGRKLIHVGLGASFRSPTGSDMRYYSRPEARFVDILVDTGTFGADKNTLLGVEAAMVSGPVWASTEFIRSDLSTQLAGDPTFHGGYVQVGWFLTGESRPYQTDSGTFGRLLPNTKYGGGNPFKKKNGGAWEVTGRISYLDLNDGMISGGELVDFSAGLSWYINATSKVMLNYIYAQPENQGAANIVVLRVQYNPW
jgi:phosphate-selective porin